MTYQLHKKRNLKSCFSRHLARVRSHTTFLGFLLLGLFSAESVLAQNTTWTAATGNFTNNDNWNNGSPENIEWIINNGGTAELSVTTFPLGGFLGFDAGQSGNLTIRDNGFLFGDTNLAVGRGGSGVLTVDAGGRATRKGLFVAAGTGSLGSVQINGGQLTLNDILHVGYRGNGSLTLTDNGTIFSDKADIGGFDTATGTATITNGLWQNTTALFVGVDGNGTLIINPLGRVASESLYVGQASGSTGSVTVSGGNITLANTMAVGVLGHGELTVTNGGYIHTDVFQVGLGSGSSGTATLSGNASLTASVVQVGVASGSAGTLSLTGNVSMSTPLIVVADELGSTGVLNVTGTTFSAAAIVAGNGTATVNLNEGTMLEPIGPSDPTVSINGFSEGQFNLSGNVTFGTGSGTIDVYSPLSGNGRLIKTGSGALNLSVASTYSGGTSIQGGTVSVGASNALGTGSIAIGTAELRGSSNSTISPEITVQANETATFSASAGTVLTLEPSSVGLNSGATLVVGSSGNNGTILFAPDDAVALPPSGGGVTVNFGTLQAGNTQLASLTAQVGTTTVATGATLDYQDHLASGGINNLQGNGTVNIGSNASTTLAVVSGNFSGSITGAGGLVKNSNGTLILSGYSEFTGGTTINGGTLLVSGSLDTGLGTVEVNTGGTLGGTGEVGPVTLSGGTLSPGNSVGKFFPTEILWYNGEILFELGPTQATCDFINTGRLAGFSLSSTYAFTFVDQGAVTGETYDLISFDPTLATAIPIESFTFTNGNGFNGTFSYRSESASTSFLEFTVITTAIPEPSTWGLLLLGSLFLAARFRHRAFCHDPHRLKNWQRREESWF